MLLSNGLHTAPYGVPPFGGPLLEHPLFKNRLDQSENATVPHLLPDQDEKAALGIVSK
jgi:hypothetical protein